MKRTVTKITLFILLINTYTLHAQTDYYWVGGDGDWTETGNWATTSGGETTHAELPSLEDNVFFDENSFTNSSDRVRLNDNDSIFCKNMDWTGALEGSGITAISTTGPRLYISGDFQFQKENEFQFYNRGRLVFVGDEQNIYTDNAELRGIFVFNNKDGVFNIQDSLTIVGSNTEGIILVNGTLNLNGNYVRANRFDEDTHPEFNTSNIEYRKLDITNSTLQASQFFYEDIATTELDDTGGNFLLGKFTFSTAREIKSIPLTKVTLNGFLLRRNGLQEIDTLIMPAGTEWRMSGSVKIKRLITQGEEDNYITIRGTNSISSFEVTDHDVIVEYANIQFLRGDGEKRYIAINSTDNGDNMNWEFLDGGDYYWVGGAGDWEDFENHWAKTSGGSVFHSNPPQLINNVYFDENSFSSDNQTVSINEFTEIKSLIAESTTNLFNISATNDSLYIRNDFKASGNLNLTMSGAGGVFFIGEDSSELSANSATLDANFFIDKKNNEISLSSNFTLDGNISIDSGDFKSNNYAIDVDSLLITGGEKNIDFGESSVNLFHWEPVEDLNINLSVSNAVIEFTDSFYGRNYSYGKVIANGSTFLYDTASYDHLEIAAGSDLEIKEPSLININKFTAEGSEGSLISIKSQTDGNEATISSDSEKIDLFYVSLQDIHTDGTATFNAYKSTDVSNNVGWNFFDKLPQSIEFEALENVDYGDANIELTATATSNLQVDFEVVEGPVTLSGNTLTITGAGEVTIRAKQNGDSDYLAADSVDKTFTISKALLDIIAEAKSKEYGELNPELTYTLDGFVYGEEESVLTTAVDISTTALETSEVGKYVITVSNAEADNYQIMFTNDSLTIEKAVLTVNAKSGGSNVYGEEVDDNYFLVSTSGYKLSEDSTELDTQPEIETSLTVSGADVDIYDLIPSGGESNNYSFDYVSSTYEVSPAELTVNISNLEKEYGQEIDDFSYKISGFVLGEDSTVLNNLPIIETNAGENPGVGVYSLLGSEVSDIGNYTYTYLDGVLSIVKASLLITADDKIISVIDEFPELTYQIEGFVYNEDENVLTTPVEISTEATVDSQVGEYAILVSSAEAENYNIEFQNGVLSIVILDQTINFEPLDTVAFGIDPFELTAAASSGLEVEYTSSDESVATIEGNIITILSAGTTIITAIQTGNEGYNPAPDVNQDLVVKKADQTIALEEIQDKTFGDEDFELTATASSGLDVNFSSSDEEVATINGTTVTILGAGTTTIIASQSGNENYNPATDVNQEFVVNKANQTVNLDTIPEKTFGDEAFELTATASSGLAVSYSSSDETVATINGTRVTILGAGTTTIIASQTGNENYNPADGVSQELVINKADQEITIEEIPEKDVEDADFEVIASTTSGLDLTYSILSGPATINGNVVNLNGEAGIVELEVSQAGNNNYNAASATTSFEVLEDPCQGFEASIALIQNVTCNGEANGSFEVNTSNGTAPFTYSIGNESQDNGLFENMGTGNYEITVTDANGCSATANVEITEPEAVEITAETTDSNSILGNGSISLTVTGGTGNYTYDWSNGETTANLSDLEIGEYSVTVTDEAGCSITESFTIGGVTANSEAFELNIYPNPVINQVEIVHGEKVNQITLIDANGKIISRKKTEGKQTQLDMKALPAGIYFIRMENGQMNRIIKQ